MHTTLNYGLLILLLTLSGCSEGDRVTPQRYAFAEESCRHFGGLKNVWIGASSKKVYATCNDGREVDGQTK